MIQNFRVGIPMHPGPPSPPWEKDGGQRRGGWSQFRSSQEMCLLPGGRPRLTPVERQPALLPSSVGKPDGWTLVFRILPTCSVGQQGSPVLPLFQEWENQQWPRKTRITVQNELSHWGGRGLVGGAVSNIPHLLRGCPWGDAGLYRDSRVWLCPVSGTPESTLNDVWQNRGKKTYQAAVWGE